MAQKPVSARRSRSPTFLILDEKPNTTRIEKHTQPPAPPLSSQATESLAELGSTLRALRKGLKVNATAAAEAAGVSRVTLHRIEKGEPSVTGGAYAAAARRSDCACGQCRPPGHQRRSIPSAGLLCAFAQTTIPAEELAWQVHGTDETLAPGSWTSLRRSTAARRSCDDVARRARPRASSACRAGRQQCRLSACFASGSPANAPLATRRQGLQPCRRPLAHPEGKAS